MTARAMTGVVGILAGWLVLSVPVLSHTVPSVADSDDLPAVYRTWETFTTHGGLPRGGLPNNDVLALRAAGDQLWVGTKDGLALREGGVWKSWSEQDGLPCAMITAIDVDERSRDVWLGSWGEGLIRFSGGRFDKFDQLNSGMPGNLVFAVAVVDHHIWAATNGGLVSFDTINDAWELHFPRRADRAETVITSLSRNERYLYATAWCEGLWRFDLLTKKWEFVSTPDRTNAAPTEEPKLDRPIDKRFSKTVPVEEQVGIEVVNIAVLRPGNKVIPLPGSESPGQRRLGYLDRLAVNLAIEQANARGGYRGKIPFALTTGPEGAFRGWGWTTPEDDLAALSQRSDVWGIVGHLGPDCRMSSAAILRSEVPLVNIGIEPATIDERINPWVFRCRGDEPQQLRSLLDHVFVRVGHTRVALLRTPGRESEVHIEWWRKHARQSGHSAVADLNFDPRSHDLDSTLREVRQSGAQVLMTWCDPQLSAIILRRMRAMGMSQMFVGSHQIVGNEFLKLTGEDPGAVIAAWPLPSRWNRSAAGRFAEDYVARFHRRPALHAYPLYEAARHLLEAIDIAGLNREAVRETLREMTLQFEAEKHGERSPNDASDIVLGYVDDEAWRLYTEAAEP